MNENNTVLPSAPTASEAPKATPKARPAAKKSVKKAAPKKAAPSASKANNKSGNGGAKGVKRTSNYREDGGLTKRCVDVLRVLAKRGRPTPADFVADALKLPEASRKTVRWALGSVRSEHPDPCSLLARKHVRAVETELDGRTEHLFEITASGKAALKKAEAE